MRQLITSQKGLTLIEVLVSIVLLAIILTSFIGLFTQSAKFINKNEQKLGTMQTAQKYINQVEEFVSKDQLRSYVSVIRSSKKEIYINNKDELDNLINSANNISSSYKITAVISTHDSFSDIPAGFIQFKIIVEDEKTNTSSETYTYIRR